jgi:2-polyprenyl-3-methyl-5-hydroxy-6-metoxy-1,4-benzoquinol methylase
MSGNMTAKDTTQEYALGSTDAEHERLIRQSELLEPITERFFREAGITSGDRVLDLGSGVGDVAMLAAKIVGPAGEVVGIERDERSIARARARVAEAGFRNVSFTQSDANEVRSEELFDAVVGRFILQFFPDPAVILRALSGLVRSGGVIAFHEPQWEPMLAVLEPLPRTHACALINRESLHGSGARTDMGLALHKIYQDAGLPAPKMRLEMALGAEQKYTQWIFDLFQTLRPQAEKLGLNLAKLGDLGTLAERMHAERAASDAVVPMIAMVGVWSRKPAG